MVCIERESEEPVSITLSDLNGKIVYTGAISGALNSIDLSSLENGVYAIAISDDAGNILKRDKVILAK